MIPTKHETLLKLGWVLSNNRRNDLVIQKYDDSDRFNNDDEATEFVAFTYAELVNVLEQCYRHDDVCTSMPDDLLQTVEKVLNKATGEH